MVVCVIDVIVFDEGMKDKICEPNAATGDKEEKSVPHICRLSERRRERESGNACTYYVSLLCECKQRRGIL